MNIIRKRWGDSQSQPIVALHGLLDNASTFDKLIPLLDVPSALCLDISGNGYSSHSPRGLSINYHEHTIQLRYILKLLYKWDKNLILLGHSFGSSLWFNYAAIFPDEVSKMINLDCARYRNAVQISKFVKETRKSCDGFFHSEKDFIFEGGYSLDECVQHSLKVRESLHMPINEESCKILIARSTYNLGSGKYYFSHDKKLKNSSFGRNTHAFNLALASKIKCQVLNIHAKNGVNNEEYGVEEEKHMQVMKENCKSCKNILVDGGHHVHLDSPEVIAGEINKFLKT